MNCSFSQQLVAFLFVHCEHRRHYVVEKNDCFMFDRDELFTFVPFSFILEPFNEWRTQFTDEIGAVTWEELQTSPVDDNEDLEQMTRMKLADLVQPFDLDHLDRLMFLFAHWLESARFTAPRSSEWCKTVHSILLQVREEKKI